LNRGGLRVDSKEAQGLFNKTATAEGVSSNLGRRIWIERFGPDLVRTVRSNRTRPAAGGSSEIGFRGGAPPELGEIIAPGIKSNGAWVCRDQRDTRDPPEALLGLGLFGIARAAAEAGLRGGARRCAAFQLRKRAKVHDI
jgi:hypothetical protein